MKRKNIISLIAFTLICMLSIKNIAFGAEALQYVPNANPSITDRVQDNNGITLPSMVTNSDLGICEYYLVSHSNTDYNALKGISPETYLNYLYYNAKTNCPDIDTQYTAFCLDAGNAGPNSGEKSYVLNQVLDSTDGGFGTAASYLYGRYKSGSSECAVDTALRLLMNDSTLNPNIPIKTPTESYRAHADYFKGKGLLDTSYKTCAQEGYALYDDAKIAANNNSGSQAGLPKLNITGSVNTTPEGVVSGTLYLDVNGVPVNGVSCSGPSNIHCSISGNVVTVSGRVRCKDERTLKISANYTMPDNATNVLLITPIWSPNGQRFVLFYDSGEQKIQGNYSINPPANCDCKTSVDLTCGANPYDNSGSIIEGVRSDSDTTEWAACIYDNADSKGNKYDVLSNSYCRISCAEEWEFSLPGSMIATSGRYFRIKAQVGATRTCRVVGDGSGDGSVTPINYLVADSGDGRAFDSDYDKAAKEMEKQYNIYAKEKAIVEVFEAHTFTSKEGSGGSSVAACSQNTASTVTCSTASVSTTSSSEDYDSEYYDAEDNIGEAKYKEYTYNEETNTFTSVDKSEIVSYEGNEVSPLISFSTPTGCSCTATDDGAGGDSTKTPEKVKEEHEKIRDDALKEYQKQLNLLNQYIREYRECTEFENEFIFEPSIAFEYGETSYMEILRKQTNKNYLVDHNEIGDTRSAGLTFYSNSSNDEFNGRSGEIVTYQYINDGTISTFPNIREAYFGEAKVSFGIEEGDKTDYQSGVYFYTVNQTGEVTATAGSGTTPLGYVYPLSINTKQGTYPYTLTFGNIGMFNNKSLGRIMGNRANSQLSGELADYVCNYTTCDPTIDEVVPQMCEVIETSTGETQYHGIDGRVVSLEVFNSECGGKPVCPSGNGGSCAGDKSIECCDEGVGNKYHWGERVTDEQYLQYCPNGGKNPSCEVQRNAGPNGEDLFCNKERQCDKNPDSYIEQCLPDCAGYSLVSYDSYSGAAVDNSGRLQFLPKTISLNNIFATHDETRKALNWQGDKALQAMNDIEKLGENIFENPELEVELTPAAMASIRSYNKEKENNDKGYADSSLQCNELGIDCHSTFLDTMQEQHGVIINKRDNSFEHDKQGYSYR